MAKLSPQIIACSYKVPVCKTPKPTHNRPRVRFPSRTRKALKQADGHAVRPYSDGVWVYAQTGKIRTSSTAHTGRARARVQNRRRGPIGQQRQHQEDPPAGKQKAQLHWPCSCRCRCRRAVRPRSGGRPRHRCACTCIYQVRAHRHRTHPSPDTAKVTSTLQTLSPSGCLTCPPSRCCARRAWQLAPSAWLPSTKSATRRRPRRRPRTPGRRLARSAPHRLSR